MAGSTSSKMATLVVIIPLLILAWFLAPMALPVFRWRHMQPEKLSKATGVPVKELFTEYKVEVRYNPRGEGDPCGWQIVRMNPPWESVNDKRDDEDLKLVRCTFISERDGKPPSKLWLGSGGAAGYKDRYWKAVVWRFPPGTFGMNKHRPVVVYRGDTLDKMEVGHAESLDFEINSPSAAKWENDDKEVEDGFKGK